MNDKKRPPGVKARYLKLKSLFTDQATGISSVLLHMDELRSRFDRHPTIGVIYLSISNFDEIENNYGWQTSDGVLQRIGTLLREVVAEMSPTSILARSDIFREEFVILLAEPPGGGEVKVEVLEPLAVEIEGSLQDRILGVGVGLPDGRIELCSGYSVLRENPFIRFERMVLKGIEEARAMSVHQEERDRLRRRMELRQIIQDRNISTLFQPIVSLSSGDVFGYEALTRGPRHTPFEAAEYLFSTSDEYGMTGELDILCRENVVRSLEGFEADKKLFLNIYPTTIMDTERQDLFHRLMEETSLSPERVVLEIAERASVADLAFFRSRLDHVREMGYLIALDDIGTGYSSLQAISEIAPDFLKIDISLTRDIHKSLIKQELMVTLTEMAARLSARVVAEGIESSDERDALRERGVELGQGFLLGEPIPLPPDAAKEATPERREEEAL